MCEWNLVNTENYEVNIQKMWSKEKYRESCEKIEILAKLPIWVKNDHKPIIPWNGDNYIANVAGQE